MRKKSITAFLCVYAALCISYCVASSVMVPGDKELIAESAAVKTEETSSEKSKSESSAVSGENEISVPDTEESSERSTAMPEEIIIQDNNETGDDNGADEYHSLDKGSEPSEEIIQEYDDAEQYDEELEQDSQDEIVEDKPSLEEYLSGLRCSGCRHNCTLLSPRCINGARKASQAESQYYQTYM